MVNRLATAKALTPSGQVAAIVNTPGYGKSFNTEGTEDTESTEDVKDRAGGFLVKSTPVSSLVNTGRTPLVCLNKNKFSGNDGRLQTESSVLSVSSVFSVMKLLRSGLLTPYPWPFPAADTVSSGAFLLPDSRVSLMMRLCSAEWAAG